VKGEQDV